uniref:CCHC-type domain-containing protein n=1 Tax=Amphimedon queenslandica TaxID=400682 RepID=A0A1X7SVI3_AMPQE
MATLSEEIEERERSTASGGGKNQHKSTPQQKGGHPTGASFFTGNHYIYCRQGHLPEQCHTVTEVDSRRQMLKTMGRCFLCLRKGHITRNCPSGYKCMKCNGMHHVSLCYGNRGRSSGTQGAPSGAYGGTRGAHGGARGAPSGAQGTHGGVQGTHDSTQGTLGGAQGI